MKKLTLALAVTMMLLAGRTWAEEPRPAGTATGGVYIRTEGTSLIVIREAAEVTIATNADTKFAVDGKEGAIGDLKPGMLVSARVVEGIAAKVEARSPRKPGDPVKEPERRPEGAVVEGIFARADGATVIVTRGEKGEEVKIPTNDKTKISVNGQGPATPADIQAGMAVRARLVEGVAVELGARTREARPEPRPEGTNIEGTLTDVKAESLTVQVAADGGARTVTLRINNTTEVIVLGVKSAPGDLKAGQKVNIRTTEGIARRIEVPKQNP